MRDFFARQIKTKTGATALASILGLWSTYLMGSAELGATIQLTVAAIVAMFLRDKEAKKEQNGEQ